MITLVHFHRQTDLPKGRAKLYEQCVEILLDLWDRQDKRLRLPEIPSLKEKRMLLEAIAFHFLKEDLLEADMPALRAVVEPLLPRIEVKVTAEGLVRQIWERSGILQEQRLGWFGFAHRALHDFLAAAYVVEHELDDLLLEKAGEERWREVILIAAGLAPAARAQRLVGTFLTRQSESAAELEMAGLTLAEDIQLSTDLRAEVRRRLLDRLSREVAATTPVGLFSPQGDSPYGCSDMAGNVWEWARSLSKPYPYDPLDGREGHEKGAPRVLRGGSFVYTTSGVRCAVRLGRDPSYRLWGIGFRVVLSPFSSDL